VGTEAAAEDAPKRKQISRRFGAAMAKRQGTVKWFNQTKGFGFIACDDGTEAFVHYSAIEGQKGFRSLKQGDRVELEISQSPKGPRAEKVRLLKSKDWL